MELLKKTQTRTHTHKCRRRHPTVTRGEFDAMQQVADIRALRRDARGAVGDQGIRSREAFCPRQREAGRQQPLFLLRSQGYGMFLKIFWVAFLLNKTWGEGG